MAAESGAGSREGVGPTRLLVPLELARPELEKLIAEGRGLEGDVRARWDRSRTAGRTKAQVQAEAENWARHTRRLLQSWLSEDVASAFASPRGYPVQSYMARNQSEAYGRIAVNLNDQVSVLEGILRRLDTYAIPLSGPGAGQASDAQSDQSRLAATSQTTYNFSGGTFGQLIAGEGQTVNNINSHIAAVVGQGEQQLAAALKRLAEVALADPELDQRTRDDRGPGRGRRDRA